MATITAHQVLRHLFDARDVGVNAAGEPEAPLPLTDFYPHVRPRDIDVVITHLDAAVEKAVGWGKATAIVGIAERSSGPLVHGLALRHGLPYSLVNWYPNGSLGDIVVAHEAGFNAGHDAPLGVVYLNGLKKGDTVVFVDDCVRKGTNAMRVVAAAQKAGINVLCACFAACLSGPQAKGPAVLKKMGVSVVSLCDVALAGQKSKIVKYYCPDSVVDPHEQTAEWETAKQIQARTAAAMRPRFARVMQAFVGVPIYRATGSDYPYCTFALTDFHPLLRPELVEDMADCMVWLSDAFRTPGYADVIVSEADRGGGPLAIAVARRTGLPFTMASWQPSAKMSGEGKMKQTSAEANVGYSGAGQLFLNGVRRGDRCVFVDDMLSSGGTAEGVFATIEANGGIVAEAHFASEKTNTGGRTRLGKRYGHVPLLSLCFFQALHGTATEGSQPLPGSNVTPYQATNGPSYEERSKKAAAPKAKQAAKPAAGKKQAASPAKASPVKKKATPKK